MKKLLVLALVLAMAPLANAALLLSVDGVVDPPDTSIVVAPSDILNIDIWGDGETAPGAFYLGIYVDGPGTLDISQAVILYPGSATDIYFEDLGGMLGTKEPVVHIELNDTPSSGPKAPLTGTLVNNILFHAEFAGDATLALFDGDGILLDTQVIHIPEPVTMVLLGLGGLMLRRRK
jgi:hypothetical protein